MSVQNQTNKKKIKTLFRPKETQSGDLSNFIPKKELFKKYKSVINKSNKNNIIEPVDWLNINVSGQHIVLFQNKPLSKKQVSLFDKACKVHYLTEQK